MPVKKTTFYSRRLGLPFVLLCVCMLALLFSLLGLFLATSDMISNESEVLAAWQLSLKGALDLVPSAQITIRWSLAMAATSLILLAWFITTSYHSDQAEIKAVNKQERDSVAAMANLLDEMAPLASGELSVRATVNNGTAGALAEVFNYVVGELRRLGGSQQLISRELGDAVGNSRALFTSVEQNCAVQSGHILQASNSLLSLSAATSELSANVAENTVFAKILADRAETGSGALRSILTRAQSISDGASQSIRLAQSLHHQSQAVHDDMSTLEDLARRVDALALNASLGSTALDLSVDFDGTQAIEDQLSSELAVLAEKLGKAVSGIRSLTGAMLADAFEVMTLIQDINEFMDEHIGDADLLAYSMSDIQQDAEMMQVRATQLARNGVRQTSVISSLSESMELINQITQKVLKDVSENAESLDSVSTLSRNLRQNLSNFNLPPNSIGAETDQNLSSARRAANRAVANV